MISLSTSAPPSYISDYTEINAEAQCTDYWPAEYYYDFRPSNSSIWTSIQTWSGAKLIVWQVADMGVPVGNYVLHVRSTYEANSGSGLFIVDNSMFSGTWKFRTVARSEDGSAQVMTGSKMFTFTPAE